MNTISTRILAAIIANTAFVWGQSCDQHLYLDGIVTIPATWTNVPKDEFYGCAKLKKVVIPAKITAILWNAFRGSALEVVEFEANSQLEIIETGAFGSTSIKFIVIPQAVTEIGASAFAETL